MKFAIRSRRTRVAAVFCALVFAGCLTQARANSIGLNYNNRNTSGTESETVSSTASLQSASVSTDAMLTGGAARRSAARYTAGTTGLLNGRGSRRAVDQAAGRMKKTPVGKRKRRHADPTPTPPQQVDPPQAVTQPGVVTQPGPPELAVVPDGGNTLLLLFGSAAALFAARRLTPQLAVS